MGSRRHLWVAAVLLMGGLTLVGSVLGGAQGPVVITYLVCTAALLGLSLLTVTRTVHEDTAITWALAFGAVLFAHRLISIPVATAQDQSAVAHLAFRGIVLLSGTAFIALGPVRGLVLATATWVMSVAILLIGPMPVQPVVELGGGTLGVAFTSAAAILMFRLLSSSVADLREQAEETAELAFLDELTGLPNRRQLTVHLRGAVARTVEGGGPDTVVMFDLDRFKYINDTLGHQVGDEVLRRTAAVATAAVRDGDIVGRWGGEEFLILLSDAEEADGTYVAERCRRALEAVQGPTAVTASFGVTTIQPYDEVTDVLRRADLALYDAKQLGRNRVETRYPSDVGEGSVISVEDGVSSAGDEAPDGRPPR